ncbi:MAG: CRISPR-associated endonuclease Cas1 [Stellaceae bacterium]
MARFGDSERSEDLDDAEWAERGTFWQQQAVWRPRQAGQKRKVRSPLVLGGHGVRLRIDRGSLLVQNGFTHYPQKREEWRFFPGHPDLPSRIVVVDGNGSVTFDVLAWLSTQAIPLVQIDWRGESLVVAGSGYVADPKLVQAQRAAQASKRRTMAISRQIIAEKIARSADTLTATIDPGPSRERALAELAASTDEMQRWPPRTMDALRGIEGRVAQAYFMAWRSIPLRWKGLGRKPIPDEWHRIGPRTPPNSKRNRGAVHPVNAMLNYGYAVLESQIRMAVVGAGLDPAIGLMHAPGIGRSPLVLDLMEPMRPVVDAVVLGLATSRSLSPADFIMRDDGACRLNPQLARMIAEKVGMRSEAGACLLELLGRIDRPSASPCGEGAIKSHFAARAG